MKPEYSYNLSELIAAFDAGPAVEVAEMIGLRAGEHWRAHQRQIDDTLRLLQSTVDLHRIRITTVMEPTDREYVYNFVTRIEVLP